MVVQSKVGLNDFEVFSNLKDSLIQSNTAKITGASYIKANEKKYKSLGSRVVLILKIEKKSLGSYSALWESNR